MRAGIIALATVWSSGIAAAAPQPAGGPDDLLTTARQAFTLVEAWAQSGRTPDEAVALRSDDLAAVCVTLRLEGTRLGRAVAAVENPLRHAAAEQSIDISPLLQRATAAALEAARKNLPELRAEIVGQPMPDDLDNVARLLSVDLQLARPPRRLDLNGLRDLPRRLVVGAHGLAVRHNDRWGWLFPATVLEANLSLPGQVQRLLGEVNLPPDAIATIGEEDSRASAPALFRFEVVHLLRLSPDQRPTRLHRGQQLAPTRPLDLTQIRRAADLWARRLMQWQGDDGALPGGYEPTADRFEPEVADPLDAGLAALALASYSRLDRLEDGQADRAGAAARRAILATLRRVNLIEGADAEPVAAAADIPLISTATASILAAAIVEAPNAGRLKAARDELAEIILAAKQPEGGFRRSARARAEPAPAPEQALIAFGMVRLYDQTRRQPYLDAARATIIQLWRAQNPREAVDLMPWIALAEFRLDRMDKATPGLITLREACEKMRALQVRGDGLDKDEAAPTAVQRRNSVGGFRLPAGLVDEPTWLSARPLIAIAAALPHKRFVGAKEQSRWLVDAALGLRFISHLTLTRDAAWYVRRPSRALGGVRTAFWDNRQPLSATALALLAAVELETSIARLAAQQTPPPKKD